MWLSRLSSAWKEKKIVNGWIKEKENTSNIFFFSIVRRVEDEGGRNVPRGELFSDGFPNRETLDVLRTSEAPSTEEVSFKGV